MVLIQVLLPTNGATPADGLAPLASRAELAKRFHGLTAYCGPKGTVDRS